jgi:hypothetical protein
MAVTRKRRWGVMRCERRMSPMMKLSTLVAAASLLALVACSGSSVKTTNLSLSAKTAAPATAPVTPSLDLPNGISLTEVRFVVRKLKLEGSTAAADAGTAAPSMSGPHDDGSTDVEHEHDAEDEPVLGPVVVDLKGTALSGGLTDVLNGVVPQGTFHELKFVIGPVTAAQAGSDAGLTAMGDASIIVDGTIADSTGATTPFELSSKLVVEVQQETECDVNDTKTNNLTLTIDPTNWFGGSGAARLDPTVAANLPAIEANIRASLSAFEDDNGDGMENHDGAGAGDHGGSGHH